MWSYPQSRENDKNEYRLSRDSCIPLIPVAYVKWQFVNGKDLSLYPLLLPQLVSDALQNVPFCSGERGLQGHTLLAPPTPSPPQPYFQPSPSTPEPLPDPGRYEISTFRKIENIFSKNPSIQFPEWKVSTMKKWISIISVVKRGSLLPREIFFVPQFLFFWRKNPSFWQRCWFLVSCMLLVAPETLGKKFAAQTSVLAAASFLSCLLKYHLWSSFARSCVSLLRRLSSGAR